MPKTRTIFEAVDGRQFDNQKKAEDYEDRLFEQWLSEEKEAQYSGFLNSLDTAERAPVRTALKKYFLWIKG